tara:strand:+ start:372 stop:755 length:384 start_codon:yes stop_codon:yes gene_type:complete
MCLICDENPKAHSFYKLAKENDSYIFYSCPADAEDYWDEEGIVSHIREKLNEIGSSNWIYIFDGKNFGIKNALEISVAKGIIEVLLEHSDTLKEIRLINTTRYVDLMMTIIKPFLPHEIFLKIKWNS